MTPVLMGYTFSLLTALIVIGGDYVIKLAAERHDTIVSNHMFWGIVLYGVSAVLWFYAMRNVTLAQAGVAYSMLTLIALCILGAMFFDEPISLRDGLGIGCALLAMLLMLRVE